ncbi:MAG: PH domain-containing protein [Nanoarchaeota archaeon]|nr:PH domain-containing protein [Nanoarchaeota archaeon]
MNLKNNKLNPKVATNNTSKSIYTIKPNIQRGMFSTIISLLIISIILTLIFVFILFGTTHLNTIIFIIIVMLYGILLIGIILHLILTFYKLKHTSYLIFKDKIIYENLFLNIQKIILPTEQITNIDSFESFFLDKYFKTGTLNIYTSGSSSVDISLNYVSNYQHIYSTLDEMIQHHKKSNIENNTLINNLNNNNSNEQHIQINSSIDLKSKLLTIKPDIKSAISLNFLQLFIGFFIFFITFTPFAIIGLISLLVGTNNLILTLFILIIIISIFIGLIYFIIYVLKRRYSKIEYHFYSNRVEYFDGFFNIIKHTIPYERITNSNSFQGFLDRIFGVYTINIETAGSHSSTISIKYVKNGEEINQRILEILQEAGDN